MLTFLLNASNVVFLASYLVKDIVWLRILTVVGGVFGGAYFALGREPAWDGVAWVALFMSINVVQLLRGWLKGDARVAPDSRGGARRRARRARVGRVRRARLCRA